MWKAKPGSRLSGPTPASESRLGKVRRRARNGLSRRRPVISSAGALKFPVPIFSRFCAKQTVAWFTRQKKSRRQGQCASSS
jgi:hypothetical protein